MEMSHVASCKEELPQGQLLLPYYMKLAQEQGHTLTESKGKNVGLPIGEKLKPSADRLEGSNQHPLGRSTTQRVKRQSNNKRDVHNRTTGRGKRATSSSTVVNLSRVADRAATDITSMRHRSAIRAPTAISRARRRG